jgi:predicted HAD superfamily phosphohydrolase YqeG
MMGSGGIQAKKIGAISHNGDAYFLFSELMSSELLSPQIQAVLKKYDSTWLSWTRDDAMKALSGATEEEALATTITNNLSKMTLSDVSASLKKHMIWKATGSSTSSGNLQVFPIDLNRENVIALVDSMSRDITGSGMTDIQK